MIEWFKSIGALGELFAKIGALVIKGQPTASFTVRDEGTRKLGCIRIMNNSEHDIAIIDACVKPEVYFLTEHMEVRTLIEGAAGRRPRFLLKPQQEKELFIAPLYKSGIRRDLKDQKVTFRVSWRRGNRMRRRQMPVYVRTSTSIIRQHATALQADR